jgi:hypothetical protein
VDVSEGHVTLRGPILAGEVNDLLAAVRGVRGVRSVSHELRVQEEGQSGSGARMRAQTTRWSPTTRLVAAAAGGAMLAYGLTLRFPTACVLGTAGLCLLARGLTNNDLAHMVKGRGRYALLHHARSQEHANGARPNAAFS